MRYQMKNEEGHVACIFISTDAEAIVMNTPPGYTAVPMDDVEQLPSLDEQPPETEPNTP